MQTSERLLDAAIGAAIEAGEAIMQVYTSPETDWGVERKADNSPLTLADKKAHAAIESRLASLGIPMLSEEGAHAAYETRRCWTQLWVVDPLDGTKEFLKRNGEFTVNIALVCEGVPMMGVIFVPVSRTLYWGVCREDGSGEACKVAEVPAGAYSYAEVAGLAHLLPFPTDERPYTAVASRSHLSPETQEFIDELRAEHPDLELRSAGSSLKICLVAEGSADVYPRFAPTMEWDTAAGHAIVRAAGGEVWQAEADAPLRYNKSDLLNPWFIVRSRK